MSKLKILILGFILCALSARSQVTELDSIQRRYLTKPEDVERYHRYSAMVAQVPMLDTEGYSIGETRAGYAAFLKTLDSVNCKKEIIGKARGYDIMGLTIGDIKR